LGKHPTYFWKPHRGIIAFSQGPLPAYSVEKLLLI
jgi:hypothetical protein